MLSLIGESGAVDGCGVLSWNAPLGTKRHPEGYHHPGVPNPQHEGLWAQDHVTG